MSDQRKANAANSSNSSISNNNKLEDPGVYMNCRLMHSFTSLIGATVEVELMGGERYEGIFKTFSPKCDLVLCSVAQIINDDESEKRSSALGSNVGNLVACLEKNIKIEDQVVFDQASLIKFRANNIDLDFATMPKKTVLTDGEISGVDGKKMQEKELVPWDDGGECDYNALEESSNGIQNGGWDSSEMFDYNERNYNINSTYNDDMSGYTIKLEQREDPDFVQRKIHAEKIAREIEKDPKRQSRLAKENDLDEETRFSAVVADRKGQRNGPNNALPINNSNNNNSNNNSMTRGSPRNEMSHSGRDGRDGQRRESMRSNRGDPGRDSRERDFSRQNSRQGGSGGGGPSGGGGRGRDMDRRIDNRGVGGGGGGDMRNDGRNDGRIDGRNDGRNDGRIDGRSDGGRNDGRGGDRGGDGRGDRGRGNDRRISGGINEANWRTDNRRSVNDRRKMDEPQLQPQQQQQQPKKADQRPSQTPPPPQTPGTPSSSISDAGTTKSDSSAFSKKDTSPKAGVTAAAVVALSVAPQPNNSPSLVPQTTLTASDSPVSGAYSKKESSPMAGAAAPVALSGGGTNVPSSPAGAAPPSGAPPSAVTTPVSASSSSSSLPTPSSASSSQSTGSGEIKSNLNPNAKAFTPRANPSPAAMQQQYMLAASQQHQQQQQQQAQQQQQQQQQAMVNFSYQSQHMVTSPPSTMPNQYIQISPHPSHLPPQSIHHHLPPHQQQGHPHQQPGHPHQQPGHPHQQQPHPHQHQAHPHQPQGQPHQQQGPHPQMGPGGPYMQFPPYNLPIPQMLPNGAQYITIPNVPTMPNAMPHGGLYTGPVPGVPTQAGPGQPTGPNPAGGPGGYPCNVFFHHNVSLPGPMPGIGGPKQ